MAIPQGFRLLAHLVLALPQKFPQRLDFLIHAIEHHMVFTLPLCLKRSSAKPFERWHAQRALRP